MTHGIVSALLMFGAFGGVDLRQMSPEDLYRELFWSTAGYRCYPANDWREQARDRKLRERLYDVRPWLVAELGESRFDALQESLGEEEHGIYWVGCPSERQQQRDTMKRRRVLAEMERRAREAGRAP